METPVWISCAECDFGTEELQGMVQHILDTHTEYTPEQAQHYAELWQESAYEQQELENIERAEYFRRHGIDMYDDGDRDD